VSSFAQTSTGDLDISTGNLVVSNDVAQVSAWKLNNLFGFALGEWFMDKRLGFPYLQFVFVKNPNMNLLFKLFSQVLRMPKGIAAVTSIELDFITNQRQLNTTFTATAVTGQQIVGGLGQPFIVQTGQASP
jgi:hypothetical protein